MNQKKVKALRKSLRQQGVDVTECKYDEVGGTRGIQGMPQVTGTIRLVRGCGRQVYRSMKG